MSSTLSRNETEDAKILDESLQALLKIKDGLHQFKVDDVCIVEGQDWTTKKPLIFKDSRGLPEKYKVIHITADGIPLLKKLNANGKVTGILYVPEDASVLIDHAENNNGDWGNTIECLLGKLLPDPDQMDSILLQQEYDPMSAHKMKAKLHNEIIKHNKSVTIPTNGGDAKHIAAFFKSLRPGDKFWTGLDKLFVFRSLSKPGHEYEIKASDRLNVEHTFNFSHFLWRRLYKDAPRSFAKEAVT